MAFDGSTHFPTHAIWDYRECVGMQAGTDRAAIAENGLCVLGGWTHGLTLEISELERERKVVIEEWRLHRGAGARISDPQLRGVYGVTVNAEQDVTPVPQGRAREDQCPAPVEESERRPSPHAQSRPLRRLLRPLKSRYVHGHEPGGEYRVFDGRSNNSGFRVAPHRPHRPLRWSPLGSRDGPNATDYTESIELCSGAPRAFEPTPF